MKSSAISQDPEVMHGIPVFSGTRVPVALFFEFVAVGGTTDEFLEQYPTVQAQQLAVLIADAARSLEPA